MEQTKKDRVMKKILIVVMYLCAYLTAVFISLSAPAGVGIKIAIFFGGTLAGWLITAFFHEAGHAVAAKCNDFDVASFSFLIFRYDKQAIKKFGISFKNAHLGETDVVPKSGENIGKRYALVIEGGIVGNIIAFAILFGGFLTFMLLSLPMYAALFCGMPVALIILIINAVPGFLPDNDGSKLAVMLKNDELCADTIKLLRLTAELYEGKSYAEADEALFDYGDDIPDYLKASFCLMKLRRAEERFEPAEIVSDMEKLQSYDDILDDEGLIELLFADILLEDDERIKKYEYLLDKCDTLPGASGMRTLVYYANYKGDKNYVKTALKSAKKICAKAYLKGDGKFNAEMLSRL